MEIGLALPFPPVFQLCSKRKGQQLVFVLCYATRMRNTYFGIQLLFRHDKNTNLLRKEVTGI